MESTFEEFCESYGLKFSHVFVPFSQSRNKDSKYHSLNWVIVLNGYSFDFQAGMGHCPAFGNKSLPNHLREEAIKLECETGVAQRKGFGDTLSPKKRGEIKPDYESVLYSLLRDGDTLDFTCFEDWCESYGFNSDSIKAKETYDTCLKTGLFLRNTFGEDFLRACEKRFEDF